MRPASSYYRVVKTAVTSAAGTKADLRLTRDEGAPVIRLSGSLPADAPPWEGWVALQDPARYAATVFSEVLRREAIDVTGDVVTMQAPRPAGLRELAACQSAPMADLVKGVNKESRNLHAEALLRLLGVKAKGEGTVEAGRAELLAFLARLDVPVASFGLQDGSGLSRSNVVTPAGLVALLVAMDRHPQAMAFRESLPIAGVDGTLKDRMKGTAAEGRVRAKTGTIALVSTLAGYVETPGGERRAFAALVNQHLSTREAVSALDALAARLAQD
jgi:PBP4 family serine-type D-alanyl-D-alanine carboxypeptidase